MAEQFPDFATEIVIKPEKRLEVTFEPRFFGPEVKPPRCICEITAMGEVWRLTLLHCVPPPEHLGPAVGMAADKGWSMVLFAQNRP